MVNNIISFKSIEETILFTPCEKDTLTLSKLKTQKSVNMRNPTLQTKPDKRFMPQYGKRNGIIIIMVSCYLLEYARPSQDDWLVVVPRLTGATCGLERIPLTVRKRYTRLKKSSFLIAINATKEDFCRMILF